MIDVAKEAHDMEKQIIKYRRDLHMIPEIGENLPETTAYIKLALKRMGISCDTYTNMGIRAVIRSPAASRTIAFRADMDALPIKEETGLSFASRHPGQMHACGHDAHVAMLLGAAEILQRHKSELINNVILLFQPAEETTGGAKRMIDEGCLRNPDVDRFISLHIGSLMKDVPNGFIGVRKGQMMASVSSFQVKVKGKGGHGARPHECVDPILIACEMIQSLQKIVSREIDPVHGTLVTIGLIKGGTTVNAIPDEVEFAGTIRCLDPEDDRYIERRLRELLTGIARANRAEVDLSYVPYYPATVNDNEVTDFLASCAARIVGKNHVVQIAEPITVTEDVAYYINTVPGSFAILGSYGEHTDGKCYPHHNARFDIDESVLWIGSALFAECALSYCKTDNI